MKNLYTLLLYCSFSLTLFSQTTAIPDTNFEQAIIDLGYDNVLDGSVLTANINSILSLDVSFKNISNLTGIEGFTALTSLNISGNNFSINRIDIALLNNLNLETLNCSNSSIAYTPDFSSFTNLKNLNISNNGLGIIRTVDYPSSIETINISYNQLVSIAIKGLPNLIELDCSHNWNLPGIGVDGPLKILKCNNNVIIGLVMENLLSIESLICSNNLIENLDLSMATNLTELIAFSNQLTSLNIKNGNNTNQTVFSATDNFELYSVCVDDTAYAYSNFVNNIDSFASFVDDCSNSTLIQVSPKIYLQGAFSNPNIGEETLMRNDLFLAGNVPFVSPFEDALPGVTSSSGNDATVDWVWVELRSSIDNTVVFGKSALLQRDGDIFDARAGGNLFMFAPTTGSYYVAIKHRNHLGIRTTNTITLTSNPTTLVDLSLNNTDILGGINSVVNINGIYCMYAGDFDGNGQIQNTDINGVVQLLGISGYSKADMDMNGQIQNTDINNFITPNIGKGQQF